MTVGETKTDVNTGAKVAIISCCYGPIEATTKPVAEQSVPCDKIFFTDNPNIKNIGNWVIDTEPYHITHNKYIGTDYTNSWQNNKTNYMISKYYKAQFMAIPRLQHYDYVLVIDGTMEITNKDYVKMLIEKTEKEHSNMVCWVQNRFKGMLLFEVLWALLEKRWRSTTVFGQPQPFQDVWAQYKSYVKNGYSTKAWRKIGHGRKNFGVFYSSCCFYKLNAKTAQFLGLWYAEILKWTTLCELSFAFVLQTNNKYKFSALPDDVICGNSHGQNNMHRRHRHGK